MAFQHQVLGKSKNRGRTITREEHKDFRRDGWYLKRSFYKQTCRRAVRNHSHKLLEQALGEDFEPTPAYLPEATSASAQTIIPAPVSQIALRAVVTHDGHILTIKEEKGKISLVVKDTRMGTRIRSGSRRQMLEFLFHRSFFAMLPPLDPSDWRQIHVFHMEAVELLAAA